MAELETLYGRPKPPEVTDAFSMILFENVAYLVDGERRSAAWRRLEETVGTSPRQILAAPRAKLLAATSAGIQAASRAERLREIAEIAAGEFGGDLEAALDASPAAARKALKKFPSIGDPGADKILLFSRREPVLALDSNGLRVLLRLGFGREEKSYAASYRSAQEATRPGWNRGRAAGRARTAASFDWLIRAHQLLRRHGQETCRRSRPECGRCPLRRACAYARAAGRASV